jgi:hypothetical protein
MIGNLACSNTFGYFCDPALDRKLRVAAQLQSRNLRAANEAWARLDREASDRAIIVPVITPKAADFVSERVRNYQRHPLFGMLDQPGLGALNSPGAGHGRPADLG